MSKAGVIVLLGLILAALPFLGIPTLGKTTIAVIGGVLVMALGLLVREERRALMRALSGERQTDAYTENGAQHYVSSERP